MSCGTKDLRRIAVATAVLLTLAAGVAGLANAQTKAKPAVVPARKAQIRPKLVVVLVVDQMRADYVEKFRGQWSGGLKRLVEEGAWFREAAYPYAATETCVGHATISTGAFPATHGIISNAWWDRESQKLVNCTTDVNAKNTGYAGLAVKGGDSAARLVVPSFADELRFQSGGASRVVTLSLKARSAIMLAGHRGDAVTWFDVSTGAWASSNVYDAASFVEQFAKAHPAKEDFGKTWSLSLPASTYLYDEAATGAVAPDGWSLTFPHALRGKTDSKEPDETFYEQWETSPFADTALVRLAETAMDALGLGKSSGTDFLGIGFSSVDYVGHAFGPRSREIQDVLIRLDRDLGEFLAYLDKNVGPGNYVVALSADHGVVPIPADMQKTKADAGWLKISELRQNIEKALESFHYTKPVLASVTGGEIYFASGVYERLRQDEPALRAVLDAIQATPGIGAVYRAEELHDRPVSSSPIRKAEAMGYFAGRSGDLLFAPKPYWAYDFYAPEALEYGTTHGTPHAYDQRVPIILMGWGIRSGEYHGPVTPADIAPTLASLVGITLAPQDGRVLGESLRKGSEPATKKSLAQTPEKK